MDDFDLVTRAIYKHYRVTLRFSKHSKSRFRERLVDLEDLVVGISKLFKRSLGLILFIINYKGKVALKLSPSLTVVLTGSDKTLLVKTIINGSAIKDTEVLSLLISR